MTMAQQFARVYELQQQGTAYSRPEELLKALGLYELTQQDLLEWRRNEFGTRIDGWASEMWAAINRVSEHGGVGGRRASARTNTPHKPP